ncbi:MAG TPA: AI-2E family transporter [Candidatus Thermoplasmatota archaeon]|nr:AI-2E family transporter [Candidatus Thermoplasmatota archaeon]
MQPQQPVRKALRGPALYLVLFALAAAAAGLIVYGQLSAVVLAMSVAYLTYPLYRRLLRGLRWRWAAASVVLLVVAAAIILPFVAFGFLFVDDVKELLADPTPPEDIEERLGEALEGAGVPESQVKRIADRAVETAAQYLEGMMQPMASFAIRFLLGLVVFFILLFFALIDGASWVRHASHVLPAPDRDVRQLLTLMGRQVKAIFYGTFLVSLIQGLLAFIGWWLLGLPAPFFWGFVMMILAVVPVLGPFLVLLPAAVWAFLQGDTMTGVWLLVLNFVLVGVVDDVLRPYFVGRSSGIHPALVLLGVVGGIPVLGLVGIIVGPLILGLVAPLLQAWSHPEDHALRAESKE